MNNPDIKWIDFRRHASVVSHSGNHKIYEASNEPMKGCPAYIEKSAYDALQSQLQEARVEIDQLKAERKQHLSGSIDIIVTNEIRQLKAEVARLQDENGKLKDEMAHMQMTDSHMAQYNIKATAKLELRERQLEISKEQRDHFIKRGNVPNNTWIIRAIEQCNLEIAALEREANENGEM